MANRGKSTEDHLTLASRGVTVPRTAPFTRKFRITTVDTDESTEGHPTIASRGVAKHSPCARKPSQARARNSMTYRRSERTDDEDA